MRRAGRGVTGGGGAEAAGDRGPHVPVLLGGVLAALSPTDGGVYIDGTFGAGGYTRAILDAATTRVLAIDRDQTAIAAGAELAASHPGKLTLSQGRFGELDRLAEEAGLSAVDGVALDIGVSSMQIDRAERGFSFAKDGPLDMRMGDDGPTAADAVNTLDEADLARVIYILGEERRSRAVARAIVMRREAEVFTSTLDLAAVVKSAVGGKPGRIHPATRTFQALRIFVNAELDELAQGLAAAERILKPGGRLAVVTFHSLEDRIAKRFLTARTGRGGGASRHRPEAPEGPAPSFDVLTRGAKTAGEAETDANPRARSARLRAAIRTDAPPWALDAKALGVPDIKTAFTGSA